jgi:hypothetical protein
MKKNHMFLLYVVIVLDPCFKLKYIKFCIGDLYDDDQVQLQTNK